MEKFGISHILADNLMSTPFCEGEPEIKETCLHSYHEDEVPINYTNILATAISSSHQLKITGIEFSVDLGCDPNVRDTRGMLPLASSP